MLGWDEILRKWLKHVSTQWLKFTTWTKILLCNELLEIANEAKWWKTAIKPKCHHADLFNWSFDKSKTEQCFRCYMSAPVNVISITLIHQPGKQKLLSLKSKSNSFHAANISYRHGSSQPQFFIIRQIRALS